MPVWIGTASHILRPVPHRIKDPPLHGISGAGPGRGSRMPPAGGRESPRGAGLCSGGVSCLTGATLSAAWAAKIASGVLPADGPTQTYFFAGITGNSKYDARLPPVKMWFVPVL